MEVHFPVRPVNSGLLSLSATKIGPRIASPSAFHAYFFAAMDPPNHSKGRKDFDGKLRHQ